MAFHQLQKLIRTAGGSRIKPISEPKWQQKVQSGQFNLRKNHCWYGYQAGMCYESFEWQGFTIRWWPIAATYQDRGNVNQKFWKDMAIPCGTHPHCYIMKTAWKAFPCFHQLVYRKIDAQPDLTKVKMMSNIGKYLRKSKCTSKSICEYYMVSMEVRKQFQKESVCLYIWTRRYPGYLQILQSYWGKQNRRCMQNSCTGDNFLFWVHQWALHIQVVHEWEWDSWARRWGNQC